MPVDELGNQLRDARLGTMATASGPLLDEQDDSRSSSSATSPAPGDYEESDFFFANNDSQSSLGVPNFQDMQVEDACLPASHRLPNEIITSILAKLNATSDLFHCMLVSKRWARNAVDLLWHRPACSNWEKLGKICQTLGSERPFFNYKDFVRRLNLALLAKDLNDGSVRAFAACKRVERLTLINCDGLTDSGLIPLLQDSAALLALDVSNIKNITDQSILAIAEHCQRLQGLNISGCDAISNDSMLTLAEQCTSIKRFKLNNCVQLNDKVILAFAQNCQNILEFDIHQCSLIGNKPITTLLAGGRCLRELRIANCELVDDAAFLDLPAGRIYEHLRILDLTSCFRLTDAAVEKIIHVAPRLRNLVLSKCRNITDAAIDAIAKLGKNLHYLHLGHCVHITDQGVKKLCNSCSRIRYIDLGCCTNLTDDSVKRLAQLPKLKRIGLVKCSSITDESVIALAEAANRPRVRRDPNGIFLGGEYCPSSLERVHLSYCINLTLKSIVLLLNSCPRLIHLSLTGVAPFQRDDFQRFCRPPPKEFTQHQRDVFCVFSGPMVARFREYLFKTPSPEDLQHGSLPEPMRSHRLRELTPRRAHAMPDPHQPGTEADSLDDDVVDDDFEALEVGEMAVDAQGLLPLPPLPPPLPASAATATGTTSVSPLQVERVYHDGALYRIPDLPPAPNPSQQPFEPMSYLGHPHLIPHYYHHHHPQASMAQAAAASAAPSGSLPPPQQPQPQAAGGPSRTSAAATRASSSSYPEASLAWPPYQDPSGE